MFELSIFEHLLYTKSAREGTIEKLYLLNTYFVLDTSLHVVDTTVNKTKKPFCLHTNVKEWGVIWKAKKNCLNRRG